jgi:hypothetical protein
MTYFTEPSSVVAADLPQGDAGVLSTKRFALALDQQFAMLNIRRRVSAKGRLLDKEEQEIAERIVEGQTTLYHFRRR